MRTLLKVLGAVLLALAGATVALCRWEGAGLGARIGASTPLLLLGVVCFEVAYRRGEVKRAVSLNDGLWAPEFVAEFRADCLDRVEVLDPNETEDWFSLALGWGLGRGLSPSRAHDFAVHLRYDLRTMPCTRRNHRP